MHICLLTSTHPTKENFVKLYIISMKHCDIYFGFYSVLSCLTPFFPILFIPFPILFSFHFKKVQIVIH